MKSLIQHGGTSPVPGTSPACDQPARRIYPDLKRLEGDGGIQPGHPADSASWIWIREAVAGRSSFVRWRVCFEVEEACVLRFHLSADQRFQCFGDGQALAFGPDRCDLEHWTATSLDWSLEKGGHELEVLVWWIEEDGAALLITPGSPEANGPGRSMTPPMAQVTWRPGFVLCAEGPLGKMLNTGQGDWQAWDLGEAVRLEASAVPGYHDIGPSFDFDLSRWGRGNPATPVVVRAPVRGNVHGIKVPGWVLCPATLPEQHRACFSGGSVRALRIADNPDSPWRVEDEQHPDIPRWQQLIDAGNPVELAAGTQMELIWDFGTYLCGYPALRIGGGQGAWIECSWAESLFEATHASELVEATPKGHRDQICSKVWGGFGDTWRVDGSLAGPLPALWWRAGRYLRIRLHCGDLPLRIEGLAVLTTGFPFDWEAAWKSDDPEWDALMPFFWRGLQVNAHETWTDCPYYEQMNYAGDTVLHCLSNYVACRDDRLSRACIRNFDHSRHGGGWVAERYPSRWRQESPTYSMLFPCLVRDQLMWRGDLEFVRARLKGMRAVIEQIIELLGDDFLLGKLHGWPFVDWATDWYQGCGPGVREGDSSIVNLHAVHALEAAAVVEDAVGEERMADRDRDLARELCNSLVARYWHGPGQRFADTSEMNHFSEHAQAFALLCDGIGNTCKTGCLQALTTARDMSRATSYFSHYILDVYWRNGYEKEFHDRLAWWRTLPALGFTALPEAPEPSRSDAHGWSAHPLYHTIASIAGIRPAAPAMERLLIRPMPGQIREFEATCLHPRGVVRVRLCQNAGKPEFHIQVPPGVTGEFVFESTRAPIDAEAVTVRI